MKTEQQVRDKLKEHEEVILKYLSNGNLDSNVLSEFRAGRMVLLWVLSDKAKIEPDELTKKLDWEITCIESTEIF